MPQRYCFLFNFEFNFVEFLAKRPKSAFNPCHPLLFNNSYRMLIFLNGGVICLDFHQLIVQILRQNLKFLPHYNMYMKNIVYLCTDF